ncbi:histone-fold-containing protein [Piedraia hortae CBS 480.64]|uniref:DNA polymerase epsilon subunit D n=1 Tax=Piedraia hortae CBS 480.64 TaxID=1314780 RepID=A0A6A7C861_9PEZI|nr:histone-fold-containing protein [Piedraia hortae CBS 480.64]
MSSNNPTANTSGNSRRKSAHSSIDELMLPKSLVSRLSKGALPPNTQIHKDALLALHKSATVFVNYIASASSENALAGGKKTLMPADVMAALKDAELEQFIPRLQEELKKYNEVQCDKRNAYRRKVKEDKKAATASAIEDDGRPKKKLRFSEGVEVASANTANESPSQLEEDEENEGDNDEDGDAVADEEVVEEVDEEEVDEEEAGDEPQEDRLEEPDGGGDSDSEDDDDD